jgi:hypothetical protein
MIEIGIVRGEKRNPYYIYILSLQGTQKTGYIVINGLMPPLPNVGQSNFRHIIWRKGGMWNK